MLAFYKQMRYCIDMESNNPAISCASSNTPSWVVLDSDLRHVDDNLVGLEKVSWSG